jgi:caffeoyl-CoA O-methyltransferase
MISLIAEDLETYVHLHTTPEPELFEELRRETEAKLPDPQMQVGPVEGAFLKLMVQVSGARRILELGTYSGYSSLAMASGLPEGGRIVTCDLDPEATALARRYFDRSPWGEMIEIRVAPAATTLAELASEGAKFDLVFIDADKESYCEYWEAVLPMVPAGGVILADNTLWSGAVLEPKDPSDHGIVAFNHKVRGDPRVEQVMLSVRDGVMFCRVR